MIQPKPHRADHVGSLLRPGAVQLARRAHFEAGTLSAEELRRIEDEAVQHLVTLQESLGLKVITDGEVRRSFWHYDFMGGLEGLDLVRREPTQGVQFHGVQLRPIFPTITKLLDFPDDHPMLEHFRYLARHTSALPKISIPGPSCCHFRTAQADIQPEAYKDPEVFLQDISRTYAKAVRKFYEAGCRYLQLDDIFFAHLCDPKIREEKRAAGQDPDLLIERYARMAHDAIKDRPADMLIGMHICRGNYKSTWVAEGPYDRVADAVFNLIQADLYFLEYDSERSGGLEPLKYLRKGSQRVYPGFITTKTGQLESLEDLKRRFDEASRYTDLDQLGIAPQCGFASTEEGNTISEDDQKRKLELVVKTAHAVWGEA